MTPTFARERIDLPEAGACQPDEELNQEAVLLAQKAYGLLGYGHMTNQIFGEAKQRRLQSEAKKNVAELFRALGIEPFNNQQVADYKKREQARKNRESRKSLPVLVRHWHWADRWVQKHENGALCLATTGSIATIISIVLLIIGLTAGVSGCLHAAGWLAPFAYFPFMLLVDNFVSGDKAGWILRTWSWKMVDFYLLSERKIEVPTFALDTAVRVKEAYPEAVLQVEVLMSQDERVGDPFLVLVENGQKYYLEAWDESRFEAKHV